MAVRCMRRCRPFYPLEMVQNRGPSTGQQARSEGDNVEAWKLNTPRNIANKLNSATAFEMTFKQTFLASCQP